MHWGCEGAGSERTLGCFTGAPWTRTLPHAWCWLLKTHWRFADSSHHHKWFIHLIQFSSVAQSCPTLRPHGLQHARPPCPSPTPGVHPNSCPLSWWCRPTISSSVIPFSSCPQSLPASESFPMSQFFASGGQSIGVSALASVPPMNIQD